MCPVQNPRSVELHKTVGPQCGTWSGACDKRHERCGAGDEGHGREVARSFRHAFRSARKPMESTFCFGSLHTEAFPWSIPLHSMPLPRPQCPRAATWRQYHAVTPGVKETSDGAQARLCNAGRKIGAKSSRRPTTGATEMGSRDSRVSWTGYDELYKFAQ